MLPSQKPDLPLPLPTVALSVAKLLAVTWFLLQSPEERARAIKVMRWVAEVFAGPEQRWPLDFGRPLSQAISVIENHRSAAAWLARLAEQLEVVGETLRTPPS